MSGMHLSKEFFELLKSIGESKSKQEEDRIILKEISTLKKKLETPTSSSSSSSSKLNGINIPGGIPAQNALSTNKKKSKEFLIRLLYVEMLGHDASFGMMKAVELCASSSIVHKRTGYLLCACCLPPTHEFRFMLVNQMQRDLASSSILEITAALIAVTTIITADMVPAMANEVFKLLDHADASVRKKAILAYHRFHQLSDDTVSRSDLIEKLRKALCDRDPSVMGSTLNVMESLAGVDSTPFKELVPSLISILKQVIEHRLPSDYDYHRVPAPWIQMKLIRILAIVGKNDASASNGMYEILSETMKKADVGINAGYAVVYECVRTITSIYPNPSLLDAAADSISRFITSKSQNLKYLGVTGLAAIVESHPQYAAAHQLSVIECLEDRDETLQRRTLDLLYKMTNPMNVTFITEKLLGFLRGTTDVFLKKDLTGKVCTLAERYAPNNLWYIETMTELFEISGDFVGYSVSQNLMTLIAEGAGEDEDDDNEEGEDADTLLRQHTVAIYANLLADKPHAKLPKLLIETVCWVLGEYAYLSEEYTLEEILSQLCEVVRKGKQLDVSTRKIIVSAIMKLVSQAGTCPPKAAKLIDDFTKSKDVDLQQRCLEFQNILTTAPYMLSEVLPVDASCEDVQVDPNLSFLDGFVHQALADGAQSYEYTCGDDDDEEDYILTSSKKKKKSEFKMTPYEKPPAPGAAYAQKAMNLNGSGGGGGMNNGFGSASGGASNGNLTGTTTTTGAGVNPTDPSGEPQLVLRNVANVWGKGGMSGAAASTGPQAPTPSTNGTNTTSQTTTAAATSSSSSTANAWSNSYTSTSNSTSQPSAAPVEPVKTEEQIRKEKMAAALFGGAPPDASSTPSKFKRSTAASKRAAARKTAANVPSAPASIVSAPTPAAAAPAPPPPVPTPAPAPAAPAPEIDLLDFGDITSDAPTTTTATDVDILAPTPIADVTALVAPEPAQPEPIPAAAPPTALVVDPFADSGLLDGLEDKPLSTTFGTSGSSFQHNGSKLCPLTITTAQFGEKWGSSCPHTSPTTLSTSNFTTLDGFMTLCKNVGAYPVESISATNEGICAGMLNGGRDIVLIHGKISTLNGGGSCRVDLTIKATDDTVGSCLGMFMQNMA